MKPLRFIGWTAAVCVVVMTWVVAIWADRTYWEPERQAAAKGGAR